MAHTITIEKRRYTGKAILAQSLTDPSRQEWIPKSVFTVEHTEDLPGRTVSQAKMTISVRSWYVKRHPEVLRLDAQAEAPATRPTRYEIERLEHYLDLAAERVAAATATGDEQAQRRAWIDAAEFLDEPDVMTPQVSYPAQANAFRAGAQQLNRPFRSAMLHRPQPPEARIAEAEKEMAAVHEEFRRLREKNAVAVAEAIMATPLPPTEEITSADMPALRRRQEAVEKALGGWGVVGPLHIRFNGASHRIGCAQLEIYRRDRA